MIAKLENKKISYFGSQCQAVARQPVVLLPTRHKGERIWRLEESQLNIASYL